MRRKQIFEGLLALAMMAVLVLLFLGASELLNENPRGLIECGSAFVLAIPVIILTNRREKA
jgi:hypothetical protein